MPLHGNSGLDQKFQCAENRGRIDGLSLAAQMLVQLIYPVMAIELEKLPNDELALRSESPFVIAHKSLKFFRRSRV